MRFERLVQTGASTLPSPTHFGNSLLRKIPSSDLVDVNKYRTLVGVFFLSSWSRNVLIEVATPHCTLILSGAGQAPKQTFSRLDSLEVRYQYQDNPQRTAPDDEPQAQLGRGRVRLPLNIYLLTQTIQHPTPFE